MKELTIYLNNKGGSFETDKNSLNFGAAGVDFVTKVDKEIAKIFIPYTSIDYIYEKIS